MASNRTPNVPSSIEFLKAAKDFSFEQKLSVVQSIVHSIPREQQKPWNFTDTQWENYQKEKKLAAQVPTISGSNVTTDPESVSVDVFEKQDQQKDVELKKPPLLDPYEKTMRYYEKHLILNHFQHMTAKMVLHRPQDTLQYMINWCQEMQQLTEKNKITSKTLYENSKIDVYDDDNTMTSQQVTNSHEPQEVKHSASFGNSTMKTTTQHTVNEPANTTEAAKHSLTDTTDTGKDGDNNVKQTHVGQGDSISTGPLQVANTSNKETNDGDNVDDDNVTVSDADSLSSLSSASDLDTKAI